MNARLKCLALASLLALSPAALAEHKTEQDIKVNVNTGLLGGITAPLGRLGQAAYNAQEGAHRAITATTGITVNHFYVWTCVDGACVPVDPFTVSK